MADPASPATLGDTIRLGKGGGRRLKLARTQLRVTAGPDQGLSAPLDAGEVRVGKSLECDLVLTDDAVSRVHFRVVPEDGGWRLEDRNSTNGTRVNGVRTREAQLEPGCAITLGRTTLTLESAVAEVPVPALAADSFHGLCGVSPAMHDLFSYLAMVARANLSVILEGETGTGKEVVGRALHRASPRAAGPFVVFDCAATDASFIAATLFGHAAGAYTGAVGSRKGAFVSAHEGTLFLDEIGDLPLELQPKLLRALERREVQPLGSDQPVTADVRVVSASHRSLPELVKAGRFREDLLYRLAGITLVIPPLRERREDVPVMAESFLAAVRPELTFAADALDALAHHAWPGNVRELRNVVERAAALCPGTTVTAREVLLGPVRPGPAARANDVADPVAHAKAEVIRRALEAAGGNKSEAARRLGITRKTLRERMKALGI